MQIIVRAYDNWSDAKHVIIDLESIGVPSEKIGVMITATANDGRGEQVGTFAASGAMIGGGSGLLASLAVAALPGIGPVVVGGWIAATVLAVVAGAVSGEVIGSLISSGVPKSEAQIYLETVRRGATVLTANVDESLVSSATEIMDRYAPINISTRADEYRERGWKEFDPNAQPYTLEHPEIDRLRS